MFADLALQKVGPAEPLIPGDVLGEIGELQPDADVVAERNRGGIANIEEAEHDAPDRRGRVHAVPAKRCPILVGIDALVLYVGVDQIDERLRVKPETADSLGEGDKDRVGALIVVEALASLVAPAAETPHRDSAVTALVAEIVGEPAEGVHPGQIAAQRPR